MLHHQTVLRLVLTAAFIFLAVAGCSSAEEESDDTTMPGPFPEEEQAKIYAMVIRHLYTQEYDGESPDFPLVYLVRTTDETLNPPDAEPCELPDAMCQDIVAALDDLPPEFEWVGTADQVPRNPDTRAVEDGGTVITLSNIEEPQQDTARVSAGIYLSTLGDVMRTYVLEQQNESWSIQEVLAP